MKTRIEKVEYFHPSGRTTRPNGHPYMSGMFCREAAQNRAQFTIPLSVAGLSGIMILPEGPPYPELSMSEEHCGTVTGAFGGKFLIGAHEYGKNSSCITLWHLSRRQVMKTAKNLCTETGIPLLLLTAPDGEIFKITAHGNGSNAQNNARNGDNAQSNAQNNAWNGSNAQNNAWNGNNAQNNAWNGNNAQSNARNGDNTQSKGNTYADIKKQEELKLACERRERLSGTILSALERKDQILATPDMYVTELPDCKSGTSLGRTTYLPIGVLLECWDNCPEFRLPDGRYIFRFTCGLFGTAKGEAIDFNTGAITGFKSSVFSPNSGTALMRSSAQYRRKAADLIKAGTLPRIML